MTNLNPFTALAQEGEPAVNTGRAVAVVGAAITLAVAFGLDLSAEKIAAVMGFVVVVAPMVQAYLTRGKVVPADRAAVVVAPGTEDVLVAGPALDLEDGTAVEVFDLDEAA